MGKKKSNFQKCKICDKNHGTTITKTYEHYDKCVENSQSQNIHGYLVRLFSQGMLGTYFTYLSVGQNCTLKNLDDYIKKEWCSCCNHMSNFLNENGEETDKKRKLSDIGISGRILYEFDMGDTTTVYIEIVKYFEKEDNNKKNVSKKCESIFKLSPNNPSCDCNKEALYYGDDGPLCQTCVEKSECETIYKIVDSPRVGVCCYEMFEQKEHA